MDIRKRLAFSLIEMLVVISIIALLIGILLPALFKARVSANEMLCMSNMSNLIKAEMAYTIDHDNYYPHYQEWIWTKDNLNDHPTGKTLPGGSKDFRQHARDYTSKEAPRYGTLNPYVREFEAHFCPSAPEMPVNGLKNGYTPIGNKVVRSYVQNSKVYPGGYMVESISKPGELLILTEENTFIMNFKKFAHKPWEHPMNDGKLDLAWDSLGSIHRRREAENLRSGYAAGAFADGHVDWVFS